MANIRLIAKNLVDAENGCTVSASPALVTTLPETNLQNQSRSKTSRTTSTASQDWKFSWASAKRYNAIAMRHNFTAAAQQRTRSYTDAAWTTGVVDNAAADCFNPTGLSRLDVFTDADFRIMKNSVRYPSLVTNMQSLNLTTTDASNPDGFMELARVMIGEYFEFAYQLPYGGAAVTVRDMSVQSRTEGGELVTDKRAKFRRWELNAEFCTAADWVELLAIQRYCGYDKELFLDIHPGDDTYLGLYNRAFVKFVDLSALDRYFPSIARTRLILEET